MDIDVSTEGGVWIAAMKGKFDIASAGPAEVAIKEILDQGADRVLIDFGEVPFIASSGLRVLLKTAQTMKSSGGNLRICSINETVRDVFEISGFDKILSVYGSRNEALSDF